MLLFCCLCKNSQKMWLKVAIITLWQKLLTLMAPMTLDPKLSNLPLSLWTLWLCFVSV